MMGFPDEAGKVGNPGRYRGANNAPQIGRLCHWRPHQDGHLRYHDALFQGLHLGRKHGYPHQEATYDAMPASFILREARAGGFIVVSTFTDPRAVKKTEAAPSTGPRGNAPGDRSRASP